MANYKLATSAEEALDYISNSPVIAFDIETAPDEKYTDDSASSLDPHKAHIVGISFSKHPGEGIYVPIAHKNTTRNIDASKLLEVFAQISSIKVAHNLSFEAMFFYAKKLLIKQPVYDTLLAAMMTLK